jgi:hypothetical protein
VVMRRRTLIFAGVGLGDPLRLPRLPLDGTGRAGLSIVAKHVRRASAEPATGSFGAAWDVVPSGSPRLFNWDPGALQSWRLSPDARRTHPESPTVSRGSPGQPRRGVGGVGATAVARAARWQRLSRSAIPPSS